MKERFIFDLDGTILENDIVEVYEYFDSFLPKSYSKRVRNYLNRTLKEYENKFPKLDKKLLSRFMSESLGFTITEKMVSDMVEIWGESEDIVLPDVIDTLEYLRQKDKSIVVLSNWFRDIQVKRLERQLLLPYFDQVYGGETYFKPSRQSYFQAAGKYPISECVMIGDNYEKDVLGAESIGMDAIYYNKDNDMHVAKNTIKSLKKIKEMY